MTSEKSELCSGKLTTWKDDRGFGFIRPDAGGKDVFLHISDLNNAARRPQENDIIYYHRVVKSDGRSYAVNAFILGPRKQSEPPQTARHSPAGVKPLSRFPIAELLLLLVFPLVGATHFTWVMGNPLPLLLYALMSLVTYGLYASDKARAKQNVWRTSEQTLHVCELLGGWPGGFVAQQVLRHKSQKRSYQTEFWAIVAIHHLAWLAWLLLGRSPTA